MATSGAQAWAKYYQGKGNVTTTVKSLAEVFTEDNKRTGTSLQAGTPITVLASTAYDTRPRIQTKIQGQQRIVRIGFDRIAKPNVKSSGAISLKPQSFNLVDRKLNITNYKTLLITAIQANERLGESLQDYLVMLVEYWSGNVTVKTALTKLFQQQGQNFPLNDIAKDFGEVLGPLACIRKNLLYNAGISLNSSAQVWIPSRPNEPLMDYAIMQGQQNYMISAKSGTSTNTVKAKDILDLLSKSPAKIAKWSNKVEYNILEVLASATVVEGPIKAVMGYLKTPEAFDAWMRNNEYLRNKTTAPTKNEIMYEAEKYLQNLSKTGELDYTELFADAIENQVIYVKFELDRTGIGVFDTVVSSDIRAVRTGRKPFLRSKNGYTRAADRMGIQI